MKPRVIVHLATSLDGQVGGFDADLEMYYGLIGRWREDATLTGSGTILEAGDLPADKPGDPLPAPTKGDRRPLLIVADSRGRVRCFGALRAAGFWRDVVVLCSRATPARHRAFLKARGVRTVVAGAKQVDMAAALKALAAKFKVKAIRVDSGGTLSGSLLRAGLVDEVSLLVHPVLAGGAADKGFMPESAAAAQALRLVGAERFKGGLVWLRYRCQR